MYKCVFCTDLNFKSLGTGCLRAKVIKVNSPPFFKNLSGDHVAKRSRALVPNSMAGEVPEKYYVIRNNEVVKVKYLLIYADKTWNNT